jgi:hypothetical protein
VSQHISSVLLAFTVSLASFNLLLTFYQLNSICYPPLQTNTSSSLRPLLYYHFVFIFFIICWISIHMCLQKYQVNFGRKAKISILTTQLITAHRKWSFCWWMGMKLNGPWFLLCKSQPFPTFHSGRWILI